LSEFTRQRADGDFGRRYTVDRGVDTISGFSGLAAIPGLKAAHFGEEDRERRKRNALLARTSEAKCA